MKRNRYVYVVAGISINDEWGAEGHLVISNEYGAHGSMRKAQIELSAILAEIREQSIEEQYTFTHTLTDIDLTVDYESGLHEYYKIYKMKLN